MKYLYAICLIFFCNSAAALEYQFTNIPNCKIYNFKEEKLKITLQAAQKLNPTPNLPQAGQVSVEYEDYNKNAVIAHIDHIVNMAKMAGISSKTIAKFQKLAEYRPNVRQSSQNQPEFKLTFERYLENMFSRGNVQILATKVLEKNTKMQSVFKDIEEIFDVEPSIAMALWMHETKFGAIMGRRKVIDALLTMSFNNPARKAFFEENLIKFLQLVDIGQLEIGTTGSWAGAFGNVQFMPQTFMKYAIDYDMDGKADLLKSEPDSMASLANYLFNLEWKKNSGIASRVILPDNFDYCNVGFMENKAKTISQWIKLGIVIPTSQNLAKIPKMQDLGRKYLVDKTKKAWLIIPDKTHILQDGSRPEAFLVYENFGKILDWNKSTFFAITIAVLQEEIEGIVQDDPAKKIINSN